MATDESHSRPPSVFSLPSTPVRAEPSPEGEPSDEATEAAAGVCVAWAEAKDDSSRFPVQPWTVTREALRAAYAVDRPAGQAPDTSTAGEGVASEPRPSRAKGEGAAAVDEAIRLLARTEEGEGR